MPKSSNGVTHVSGNQYRIRVKWTDAKTGKVRNTARLVEANGVKEARMLRAALLEEMRTASSAPTVRQRLSDFARAWFEARKPSLKHSTALRYGELLDAICHGVRATSKAPAVKGIGDVYLDALESSDVKAFLAGAAERYSGYTCLAFLRILRTVTKDAQRELRLPAWACDGVKRPKDVSRYTDDEPNALTPAELGAVLEDFKAREPVWYSYALVAAYTGLRPCEIGALKWGDIDLETGAIRVSRTVYRGNVSDRGKTVNSRRIVVLPPEALAEMRPLAGEPEAWMFARPSKADPDILVPPSDGALSKPLGRALPRLGIQKRVTPYAFRRTMNTIAMSVAPAELVRKVIGHADATMTRHYLAPDHAARASLAAGVFAAVAAQKGEKGVNPSPPADPPLPN